MLHYIQIRLSSLVETQQTQDIRSFQKIGDNNVGVFLNLNCGHNNPFSSDEKEHLQFWLQKALTNPAEVV
jgi:hypothetical protein